MVLIAVSFFEYGQHLICHLVIFAEVALIQSELRLPHFFQADDLVVSNQSFASNTWLDELEERQRLILEKVGLLNSDSLVLIVFPYAADCIFDSHLLLL